MLKNHCFFRIRTARAGRNFENSCRCFSMTYGAIRVILWCAVLKFLRNPMVFEDFGVRARRKNECVPHGIIWQGWWPWQVRNRCCRSSKHVKKLLAKALLTEMLKKCWVSYESARARGMKFWHFFLKNHWVFNVLMLKSLRKLRFWKDFVLRARMSTLPYFLQGIIEVWSC